MIHVTEFQADQYSQGLAPCQHLFRESERDIPHMKGMDPYGKNHYYCNSIALNCIVTKECPVKYVPLRLAQACAEHCPKYKGLKEAYDHVHPCSRSIKT